MAGCEKKECELLDSGSEEVLLALANMSSYSISYTAESKLFRSSA